MEIIMEQFLKEKKPVIKLITYSLLFVTSIISFSCASREEKEINELMNAVFEWELSRGEEVIVFAAWPGLRNRHHLVIEVGIPRCQPVVSDRA